MEARLSNHELIELWLAAADEHADGQAISDEQREALNRLIEEDAQTRGRLIALSQQLAWLMWHGSAGPGSIDANNVDAVVARISEMIENSDTAAPQETSQRANLYTFLGDFAEQSGMLFRPPMVFFTLLAAVVLSALVAYQVSRDELQPVAGISRSRNGQEALLGDNQSRGMPAAFLTVANGIVWGGNAPPVRNVGSAVQVGDEIAINEGIAEFRLASGVSLSVEGPASLVLKSDSSLVLLYGKLTIHVPWTVTDFRTTAGACQFTACDAEFGLWQQSDKVDLHVFRGEVQATNPLLVSGRENDEVSRGGSIVTDDAGAFACATITAGSTLSLVGQGNVYKVASSGGKVSPEIFATNLPMAGSLPISPSYVKSVLESKPLGYWRFENVSDGCVTNEVAGGFALKAVGDVRLVGRGPNRAAEFQPGANAYFVGEELIDDLAESDYTLEIWVKPSHMHHGGILALRHKEAPVHASGLELQGLLSDQTIRYRNAGTVRFVHHNRSLAGAPSGTSCFSENRYQNRRWHHVTAVKQGSQMRLFLNGKLSATSRDQTPLAKRLQLVIGLNLNAANLRRFVGQIDEAAIYNRALTEQEVAEHHRLASQATEERRSDGGA